MVEVVRIGAVDFRVKENPELPLRNNWIGCISTSVSEIELAPALSPQMRMQTLLHEMVHAILKQGRVEEKFTNEADMEVVVDVVAYGVLGIIRDNPELMREIVDLWTKGEEE